MVFKSVAVIFLYYKVTHAQYYSVPVLNYPSFSYNYYSPPTSAVPIITPTYPTTVQPKSVKVPKRSVTSGAAVKCAPQTASAYFLPTPTEKVTATALSKEKVKQTGYPTQKLEENSVLPPKYSCPLCNNFADVPPNPKISPPPPVGSSVLPGVIDEIPTIAMPKKLTNMGADLLLTTESPLILDMYEKNKLPKNLSFDQELLEGFLTGLGISQ